MIRVYADMVGDLFHPGHVRMLRAAREMGDFLVVGVLSDAAAESYKRRPVMSSAERVEVIAACRWVDLVLPDAPLVVTREFLREHAISLVVHGGGMTPEAIDAVYRDPHREGMLRFVDLTPGLSTTAILERIRTRLGA